LADFCRSAREWFIKICATGVLNAGAESHRGNPPQRAGPATGSNGCFILQKELVASVAVDLQKISKIRPFPVAVGDPSAQRHNSPLKTAQQRNPSIELFGPRPIFG